MVGIDNTLYSIETKRAGSFVSSFNTDDLHGITRGEQTSFELHFPGPTDDLRLTFDDLVVNSTYTVSNDEIEKYNTVTVNSNATLIVDGTLKTTDLTVIGTVTGDGQVTVRDNIETYLIDGVESYDDVIVGNGYHVIVEGTLQAAKIVTNGDITVTTGNINIISDLFSIIRKYEDYAGSYVEQTTVNGVVRYHEQLPARADVDSLVLGIRPSEYLTDRGVLGIWCIVDDVTDTRPLSLSDDRLRISVTVLAEYDEYDSHSEIEADLRL